MMSFRDNSKEVADWWEVQAPADHELQIQNVEEYAQYLHDKHGFYVLNDDVGVAAVMEWVRELLAAGLSLTDANLEKALDGAGYQIINTLQALTGESRPPAKTGEGSRQAHGGGWADITRNLAGAYVHVVDDGSPTKHSY